VAGLTYRERVVRLHEGLTKPRLAHFVGATSVYDVAVFSQARPGEEGGSPIYQILTARVERDGAFASTHGLFNPNNALWTPEGLRLQLVDYMLFLPYDDSGPRGWASMNKERLWAAESPVPLTPLPNTEQALITLLQHSPQAVQ
jgi:hypothetical protein